MSKHDFAKTRKKKNWCCTFLDILKKYEKYFCNRVEMFLSFVCFSFDFLFFFLFVYLVSGCDNICEDLSYRWFLFCPCREQSHSVRCQGLPMPGFWGLVIRSECVLGCFERSSQQDTCSHCGSLTEALTGVKPSPVKAETVTPETMKHGRATWAILRNFAPSWVWGGQQHWAKKTKDQSPPPSSFGSAQWRAI